MEDNNGEVQVVMLHLKIARRSSMYYSKPTLCCTPALPEREKHMWLRGFQVPAWPGQASRYAADSTYTRRTGTWLKGSCAFRRAGRPCMLGATCKYESCAWRDAQGA